MNLRRLFKWAPKTPEVSSLISTPLLLAAFLDDLHEYNIDAKVWTELSSPTHGTQPTARDGHGFASAGDKLYVHGGRILIGVWERRLNFACGNAASI